VTETPTLHVHQIVLTRILDAPPERVWAAWTTPEQVERWFAPRPVAVKPGSVVLDPRPGGRFALTMVMPDGTEYPNDGSFSELDRPRRLAFGGPVENHPGLRAVSTVVTFADLGDGRTELTVTQTLTCSDEMPELARRGWTQALDQLADVVAEPVSGPPE
jgi:uncharacterized protein YndB with AHSA1/START domain